MAELQSSELTSSEETQRQKNDVVDCVEVMPAEASTKDDMCIQEGQDDKEYDVVQFKPRDTVDAAPTGGYTSADVTVKIARMPVEKDQEEYNMSHPKRGRAIIFNHEKFEFMKLPQREGTAIDCERLKATFERLKFKVDIHTDLTVKEIRNVIRKVAEEDHDDSDCLVVVITTHGQQGDLCAKDNKFDVSELWIPFKADECLSLAGKPKLFFIQACRGYGYDQGVQLQQNFARRGTHTDAGGSFSSYRIPTNADFLLAYSSCEGFYSWRNTEEGTWFIKCLCEQLDEYSATKDLLSIMTRVSRRVAVDFQSDETCSKQVPSIVSMLTREVYFR